MIGDRGRVREACAVDAGAEGESADEDGLTHQPRSAAASNGAAHQRVDHPSTDEEIGERRDEPRDAGIERGVQQIDVQAHGEIRREPGEHQIENIVVRGEADRGADDLALTQQIQQGRTMRGSGDCGLRLGVALGDQRALGRAEARIFAGIAVDVPEKKEVDEADETQ